ncbi:hypothetical protein TNCV_947861 [Trichonephila clavipes]|nr:hypothetical protein TNCV_947861 [Trichonephila clavipes]
MSRGCRHNPNRNLILESLGLQRLDYAEDRLVSYVDGGLPACATEVEDIVNLSEPTKSDAYAEIDIETPTTIQAFSNASQCLETVKTYLMQRNVNVAVFSFLNKVLK